MCSRSPGKLRSKLRVVGDLPVKEYARLFEVGTPWVLRSTRPSTLMLRQTGLTHATVAGSTPPRSSPNPIRTAPARSHQARKMTVSPSSRNVRASSALI